MRPFLYKRVDSPERAVQAVQAAGQFIATGHDVLGGSRDPERPCDVVGGSQRQDRDRDISTRHLRQYLGHGTVAARHNHEIARLVQGIGKVRRCGRVVGRRKAGFTEQRHQVVRRGMPGAGRWIMEQ